VLLDPREFAVKTAVRTVQLVRMLQESGVTVADSNEPLQWAVGADLVRRMADPAIFSDADVQFLAQRLNYSILDREGDPARAAVELLRQKRGVMLNFKVFDLGDVPGWLAPFLQLSSTLIRHAAQSGDPLGGMLPLPAAEYIAAHDLYKRGMPVAKLVTPSGLTLGEHTALQISVERFQAQLDAEALAVTKLLVERRERGLPHGIAIGEGSVGGVLTQSLACRAGASRFFRQARFFYDRQAKLNLLGTMPEGTSSVTGETVGELAKAMLREAKADYALAESGMAGPPDGIRKSLKNGQCWIALAGPEGVQTELVALNPFLTRKEHMIQFSRRALMLLRKTLEKG
jgi:nicotinamide-nucleotide amidase